MSEHIGSAGGFNHAILGLKKKQHKIHAEADRSKCLVKTKVHDFQTKNCLLWL